MTVIKLKEGVGVATGYNNNRQEKKDDSIDDAPDKIQSSIWKSYNLLDPQLTESFKVCT